MASTDLHQVSFTWPHPGPTTVIVTGTFDGWSSRLHMTKAPTGFEAMIRIPWESKIKYKFVVDGQWLLREDHPTETDPGGYVNNIYTAPTKPILQTALNPESSDKEAVDKGVASEGAAAPSNSDALKHGLPNDSKVDTVDNLANTVSSGGTTSALDYVASGLGVDAQKISIPTPKLEEQFPLVNRPTESSPTQPAKPETSIPELRPSPIAPTVPIMIIPVNASENNTISSSSPPEQVVIPLAAPETASVVPNPSPPLNVDIAKETLTVESTAPKAEAEAVVGPKLQKDAATPAEPQEEAVEEQAPAAVENVESVSTPSKADSAPSPEVVIPPTDKVSTPPASSDTGETGLGIVEDTPPPAVEVVHAALAPNLAPDAASAETTPAVTTLKPDTVNPVDPLFEETKAETPASIEAAASNVEGKRKTTEVFPPVEPTPLVTHQVESESKPPTNASISPSIPPKYEEPKLSSVPESTAHSHPFPSTPGSSVSQTNSPSSSKFNSSRKKRTSIFGKLKSIFHSDKEKEKK